MSSPPLEDEYEEQESLLSGSSNNNNALKRRKSFSDSWKWYHTATVLCIRMIMDFVLKNPLVFYLNYQQGLGVTYMEFAYILIASEIGCIFAIFFSTINKKYFKTDDNIMIIYLLICGIACILIPALSYFNISQNHNEFIIIWCCFMRFIVGLSFSFISAASIAFASKYVANKNKVTSIIAILHYSWPLSTAINIIAGYIILSLGWMEVFVFSGVALIFISIGSKLIFKFFPLAQSDEDDEDSEDELIVNTESYIVEDQKNNLMILFTDLNSLLIIFVSFFMSLRSRTIYIVTSSLWMEDTFSLNSALVGWSTMSVIIGEVAGLAIMSTLSHKWKLWQSAAGALTLQLVVGALLFILSAVYGNNITLVCDGHFECKNKFTLF